LREVAVYLKEEKREENGELHNTKRKRKKEREVAVYLKEEKREENGELHNTKKRKKKER
jgi:hypothetical protein